MAIVSAQASGKETTLRVAVIADSPPLSYVDGSGKMTGFNVEVAHALCQTLKAICHLVPMPIGDLIPSVAQGAVNFAAVAFVPTPERRQQVLFTKPYFYSVSFFLAKPSAPLGGQSGNVAVIKGSAQAKHAKAADWSLVEANTQQEIGQLLDSGRAQSALLPMIAAMQVLRAPHVRELGLTWSPIQGPDLGGSLHMPVNAKQPALVDQLNDALDTIKRNGQFDQINTRFIPFKLL